MVKRICSLLTLMVLVLTQCFTPIDYVLAENIAEQNFEVEENINEVEEDEEASTTETDEEDTITEDTTVEIEETEVEKTNEQTLSVETDNNEHEAEQDTEQTVETTIETNNSEQDTQQNTGTTETDNNNQTVDPITDDNNEQNTQQTTEPTAETGNNEQITEPTTGNNNEQEVEQTTGQTVEQSTTPLVETGDNEEGVIDTITEEIEEIITKIRYFFNKEGDSRYIKYGKDRSNIGTITLKDPNGGASITIMDKNLGAESVGVGRSSYGYYFQWGNNHGVKSVTSSNKTTQKAVYKDSYYSRGYDGEGLFIVGSTDYWEDGAHYNSLWGSESKESSRYGACPVGYHIPTMKEWNELLSIWGKIHTQDTSAGNRVLRYSENYATRNIHTFKTAATKCAQGETECVDEDKLSTIIEVLSSELKLPLAGSYDENGNYHDGLGVYWTTISKNGNIAGVFDVNAYIGGRADEKLMYKSQGHSIRCFQNVYPYEAPVDIDDGEENQQTQDQQEVQEQTQEQDQEQQNQQTQEQQQEQQEEQQQENTQNTYSVKDIPSKYVTYTLVLDTTKELINVELKTNGGKFDNEEEIKILKYGYYNQEATIDVEALKQDEYRSGYELEEGAEKELTIPAGYKLMDEVENPIREGYDFDGWYIESETGEKVDIEKLNLEKLDVDNNPITENMQLYAHWVAKEYTITWKNEDGTIRDVTKVLYGQMPTHEDPIQPADEKYSYVFAGWEPKISEVRGDAEYKATYTYVLRKYTVTWKDGEGNILKTDEVAYGTVPTYNGETPVKESTEEYSYTFAGWDPEVIEVKGDTEYVAQFDSKEIEQEYTGNDDTGDDTEHNSTDNDLQTTQNGSETNQDSGEIDTGDVETGEVLEYTEEDRELELAEIWKTLNEKEIIGRKVFNYVTVSVYAPEGSFPEGVELRITPITGRAEKQAIKDELIENTEVTEESEVVFFDISFIYTLKNGEEIEVQPKEGKTVKVAFNYTYNDNLKEAENDNNKELKIYHFEEQIDNEGKKTEEVEIKEIEINKEESGEGKIVIDTDKFSVYGVAEVDNPLRAAMCTVTFVNGECYFGTQEEDGICNFDMPEPIEIECGSTISRQVIDEPYYTNTTSKYDASYNYNYYFSRWSTRENPGYTNTSYNYNFSTSVTSDLTLYAIGTYKSSQNGSNNANYTKTVTFNANGGTLTSTGSMLYGMYGLIKQPSDPIRAGYKLNCWTTSQNGSCSNAYDFNSTTNTVTDNVNLYAQWTVLTYTIAFSAGNMDAQGSTSSINASYNTPSYAPDCGFYKEGYICSEWNTDINGNGTRYKPGDELLNLTGTNNATVTLYAQWGEAVTITFNSNGGSTIEPLTLASGYTATQPADPTKTGYRLVGWFTDPELTSEFNFSTPITADITLYAKWEESNTLTVTFNANGGVLAGESSQEVEYGERVTKPADPTKSGSGFMYWTTDSAGNNEYNFNTPVTGDLILYAKWARICTVTFTNGYCYRGTNTNSSYRAQCTFDINPTTVNVACGTPVARPADPASPISVRMGSIWNQQSYNIYFSRWSTTSQPGATNSSSNWNFDDPITQSRTLYAIGYIDSYTVTFNPNGGILGDETDQEVLGNYGIVRKPVDPTRTGYDFKWWSDGTSTSEYNFSTQIRSDKTLNAQWTPITYVIRYNANGGTGTMSDTDMTYDSSANLRTNTFTKENATFSGWNTKANGSGTGYSNGASVNNLTDVAGRTVNLYAQWNCNSGYHDEGGICVSDIQNCEFQGQTIADGSGIIAYSTSSTTCPTTCTTGIVTCTNGVLGGNTGYTNLSCSPLATTCDVSFTLSGTSAHGIYTGCTPYTVNGNSCTAGTTVYKLNGCDTNYHTENGTGCISNTKSVACTQSGKPANSHYITGNVNVTWQGTWNSGSWPTPANCSWICDEHYHTGANNNSCEIDTFQITWIDGNGETLTVDTVDYNEVPTYGGSTPTKTATAQYTYTFNGNWSPTPVAATADAIYTAQFNSTVNQYTATIVAEPNGYGTVSPTTVKKDYNSNITTSSNTITIGGTTVTATPTAATTQYTYTFSGWINTCGNGGTKLTGNCTITAQFKRTTNKYLITFKNWDGSTLKTGMVEYGTTPTYGGATPTKPADAQYTYSFAGWDPEITAVNGAATYTAQFNSTVNQYTATIVAEPNGYGTVSPTTVKKDYNSNITTSSNTITIGGTTVTATPTAATDEYTYEFVNWINNCGNTLTGNCTITANFSRRKNSYTVHFLTNNAEYGNVNNLSTTLEYGAPIIVDNANRTVRIYGSTTTATPTTGTAQYTYTFIGWTLTNCGEEGNYEVRPNCEITANFERTKNEYTVTWKNSDGSVLETDTNVEYGTIPSYDGVTPTSGGDAQYSYTFNGWSPETGIVQGDVTYTATYIQNVNTYTVTIRSSGTNSGTVTTGSITVPYGTSISKVDNVVTIGSETSTANASPQTWQYDFNFVDWTDTCGGTTVTTGCEIMANFESLLRTYTLDLVVGTGIETIYYKVNGAGEFMSTGETTTITGVEAGSTIYAYAEPKDGYTYTGPSAGSPWSVLVTGNNVFSPEATANTNTQYIVYHYVKRVGENTYAPSKTDILSGTTDEVLTLSSLAKESEFLCAHYEKGSLTGNESGPGEIVTQTTIKGDGSTKIYLYYTRYSHTVHLSGDEHVESLKIDGEERTEAVLECGSEVPVDATPKPGYHIIRWDREETRRSEDSEDDEIYR